MPALSLLQPAKARVLLLEEDPVSKHNLATRLRAERYEVRFASNRRQAIEVSRTGKIEALVLDLDLPSTQLRKFVGKFSAEAPRCRTLVIARSLEQLIMASEAGGDIVLMGPLDADRIGMVMKSLLARVTALPLGAGWGHVGTVPFFELPKGSAAGEWNPNNRAQWGLRNGSIAAPRSATLAISRESRARNTENCLRLESIEDSVG